MKNIASSSPCSLPPCSSCTAQPRARPPAYKALKFPPLPRIKLPKVEAFTLPNGMQVYPAGKPRTAPGPRHRADPHRQPLRPRGQSRSSPP